MIVAVAVADPAPESVPAVATVSVEGRASGTDGTSPTKSAAGNAPMMMMMVMMVVMVSVSVDK